MCTGMLHSYDRNPKLTFERYSIEIVAEGLDRTHRLHRSSQPSSLRMFDRPVTPKMYLIIRMHTNAKKNSSYMCVSFAKTESDISDASILLDVTESFLYHPGYSWQLFWHKAARTGRC